ncbi:MAG: hypothetical protein LIP09_08300 [Bacteroidales bacterium]|nr:hypothetical protein [Bacteroidales bacterium]
MVGEQGARLVFTLENISMTELRNKMKSKIKNGLWAFWGCSLFATAFATSLRANFHDKERMIYLNQAEVLMASDYSSEIRRDTVVTPRVTIAIDVPPESKLLQTKTATILVVMDENNGSCVTVNLGPAHWHLDSSEIKITERKVENEFEYEAKGYRIDSIGNRKLYRKLLLPTTQVTLMYLNVDSQKVQLYDSIIENVEVFKSVSKDPPDIFEQIIENLNEASRQNQ